MRLPATKSTDSLQKVASGSQASLPKLDGVEVKSEPVVVAKALEATDQDDMNALQANDAIVKNVDSEQELFNQSNATDMRKQAGGARLPPPRPQRPPEMKSTASSSSNQPPKESQQEHKVDSIQQVSLETSAKTDKQSEFKVDKAGSSRKIVRESSNLSAGSSKSSPKIEMVAESPEGSKIDILNPQVTKLSSVNSQQSTQISVSSAVTMADTSDPPQRVDISTGEPTQVDPALDSPKFQPSADQLLSVLKLDHRRMSALQKESYRQYLVEFIAYFTPKETFAQARDLQNNNALVDQCFECMGDDKNFSLDKILNIVMILSRQSGQKVEPRTTKVFEILKQHPIPVDMLKEAIKSLINYAEANAKTFSAGMYVDVLMSHYSARLGDADCILPMLKLLRNLTVPEPARKQVLEKLGFLIVNSINQHLRDKSIAENACWVLGNCAVSTESVTYFASVGTFQALKSAMVTHTDQEKVIESALWLLYNVTFDQASIKIILKSLLEENIIDAIKRYGARNTNIFTWADYVLKRLRAALQASSPQAVAERTASKSLLEEYVMVQTGLIEDYVFQKYIKRYMVLLPAALLFTEDQNDYEVMMEVRLKDVVDISTYPPQVKEPAIIEKAIEKVESTTTVLQPLTSQATDSVPDQEIPLSYPENNGGQLADQVKVDNGSLTNPQVKPVATSINKTAELQAEEKQVTPKIVDKSIEDSPWPQHTVKVLPKLSVQIPANKVHVKQIKITSRQRILILQGKTADYNMADMFVQLKNSWKQAVSAVTENAASSEPKLMSPAAFSFSVPETILAKDLEKMCLAHVIHEIYCNPFYVTYKFKCQSKFPNVAIWDFMVVKLTKKISVNFIDHHAEQYKTERGLYDVVPLKAQLSQLVDDSLMSEVENFEASPDVSEAPVVSTMYEYCAKQGIRPTMEDRHIHLPYIDYLMSRNDKSNPSQYYAVYDGHGGTHVAAFVETFLHYNLMKHPLIETDIKKALQESFMKTQEDLKQASDRLYLPTTAGSTAVVLYFSGKKMYCAWAGDSLASLYRKKEIIELVDPHKPTKDTEKARIEKLGGFVAMEGQVLRVNGVVAVSRAFGNIRHRVIIPECDIKEIDLTGDEEYIVLACDGLWDVMTSQQVRHFVTKFIKKHGNKTAGLSEALVDESLRLGSTDNVSVVFIEFKDWKLPKRT